MQNHAQQLWHADPVIHLPLHQNPQGAIYPALFTAPNPLPFLSIPGVCVCMRAVCVQWSAAGCVNERVCVFLSTDSMPCKIRRLLKKSDTRSVADATAQGRRGEERGGIQCCAVTNVIP